MVTSGNAGALDFLAQCPGMMLRMVAWLLRSGHERNGIAAKLSKKAEALSMQTLVTNLNYFGKLTGEERAYAAMLSSVFVELLRAHMAVMDTVLRNKKVALAMPEIDLNPSELHCNGKFAEGGFIRSGIDALGFFIYWNDDSRVDIDLHTAVAAAAAFTEHLGTRKLLRLDDFSGSKMDGQRRIV